MNATEAPAHRKPEDGEAAAGRRSRPGGTPAVIRLLTLATFVVILNETLMINAMPRLMADLDITEQSAQWLSTAFMLTMAAVIPVTGWFLQRVTTRRAYATAMGVFLAGTALAAVAPVFQVLLLARIVQASGTAVMMPLLMTTLMTVVPERDRGRVMGSVTMAISVAPAMGPAVSGVILQLGSWRLLFAAVLPITAVIAWRGLAKLENVGEARPGGVDWFSVAAAAAGFGSLVYGLSRFGGGGTAAPAAFVLTGLAAIAVFGLRQVRLQRRGTPLLDLRVLRHPTYALSLLLMSLAFMAMLGSMILLPIYLQNLRGLTPLQTGLLVMPGGLAMGLLGPVVGRLFDRFGARPLVVPGAVGIVLALAGFTQISTAMPYWQILALHTLLMVSLAAMFTPAFTLGLGALPAELYSHGSSMLGTLQQVASALGTALVVTVMASRADARIADGVAAPLAQLDGMRLAFVISAVLSLAMAGIAVLLTKRARPAAEPEPTAGTETVTEAVTEAEAEAEAEMPEIGELVLAGATAEPVH
ncbi:MDR family MFS transporter [Actinomadura fibrosa]|uniref:MDR family MFS transporter n=1 Tax=Actinomadura fibrosa TaxID=111802 RepID=A0ABW2Y0R9_9ACTN|nr:MDR family MFS transporter [Actinomadura fibrosa]